MIQTDASEFGLGAALLQGGWPIAFASETPTDIDSCYVNIERECLSVCFGLEKFHTYIYGRHVVIENDHKPLECWHMLMSTLPMTQFWSVASSAHQYACSPTAAFTLMQLANETALVSSLWWSQGCIPHFLGT